MMSYKINKRISDDRDQFSQQCRVPACILHKSAIKAGDIVCVNLDNRSCICRVFPSPPTDLERTVVLDDTVCFDSLETPNKTRDTRLSFPDDFKVLKTTVFEKVELKLVLRNETQTILRNELYRDVAFKLLQNYVLTKNACVKCVGLKLANRIGIRSILITNTFSADQKFGRLCRTSNIEIVEVLTEEQLRFSQEYGKRKLGGINDERKLLSFYLLRKASKNVVVMGPPGCGKTSFVKKICFDLKCNVITIDCMEKLSLTINECNAFREQLLQFSKLFPDRPSVLFVDHVDKTASSKTKHQMKYVATLVYLFKSLLSTNISIVVAVSQKSNIHPAISQLFDEEVFLGIPNFEQRKEMLECLTTSSLNNEIDYSKIAGMMPGFVACDIAKLVQEATKLQRQSSGLQVTDTDNVGLTTLDFEKALLSVSPSVLKTSDWNLKVKPVYWKDIGGMARIKERLQLSIEKPLLHPEIFKKVDLHCPRGVLLFGPPGCCKTTLARGLATECNANFFAANPSQIYSAFVGESEKNISQLFYQARLCAPSIVFLDELDSLVGCRNFDSKQQGVAEKVLSTLLNEMDGLGIKTPHAENSKSDIFKEEFLEQDCAVKKHLSDKVIVVAATNRPDCIDDALLRPGRFDVILYVPPPNLEERASILQTVTNGMPLYEVNLTKLAEITDFFTGADLKNLCNRAAMNALRQDLENAEYVTEKNFLDALKIIKSSVTKDQIEMYEKLSTKYGPVLL